MQDIQYVALPLHVAHGAEQVPRWYIKKFLLLTVVLLKYDRYGIPPIVVQLLVCAVPEKLTKVL